MFEKTVCIRPTAGLRAAPDLDPAHTIMARSTIAMEKQAFQPVAAGLVA